MKSQVIISALAITLIGCAGEASARTTSQIAHHQSDEIKDPANPLKDIPPTKDTSYDPTITPPTSSSINDNLDPADKPAEKRDSSTEDQILGPVKINHEFQNSSDMNLSESIQKILNKDASSPIQVTSANGLVTLRGVAASPQEKAQIESKVKAISGVKRVNNQIEIKQLTNKV